VLRTALIATFLLPLDLPAQGTEAQAAEPLREPFLRLRIDNRDALAANRHLAAAWRCVGKVVDEESETAAATADRIAVLWNGLPMPLELFVTLEKQRVVWGLLAPSGAKDIGDALRELGVVPPRVPQLAGEDEATARARGSYGMFEGDVRGRHVVMYDSARATPDVDQLFAAIERTGPGTRRLQRTWTGKGLEVLINTDVLAAALPDEMRPALGGLKMVLGPRFSGVLLRADATADRLTTELHTDLVPGQGILGAVLPKAMPAQRLAGWIPADALEFFNLYIAIEGVATVLQVASTFGGLPLDPAEWGEGFETLAGTDIAGLLADNLSGEVQMLMKPTTAAEALDVDAEVPGVFMFGTPDGAKAFGALREVLDKWGEDVFTLTPAPDFGEHVHELSVADEKLCRIVAHPTFLAFAGTDETSTSMLRKTLATKGEAKPPAALRERLGDAERLPMLIGLQHMLSNVQGQVFMRDMLGRPMPGMDVLARIVDVVAAEFTGDLGITAYQFDASADGLRIRQVW
jgi:hypothetical protein